jgi:uncharacterized membrane protein YdjX (TVP38/TMEM64 family)
MSRKQTTFQFRWTHAIAIAAVVAVSVWIGIEAAPVFTRSRLEAFVRGAGPWGPYILLGLQIAQILVAPIPGVFMPILAGALYGPVVGVLIVSAGTVLGSSAAYAIGGRAGLPLLKRWLGEENVAKAQRLVGGKRWLALVLIFLVPFSPSDAICFVAGMIGIKPDRFFLAVLIGRVPKDCALALAGAGLIRLGGFLSASG